MVETLRDYSKHKNGAEFLPTTRGEIAPLIKIKNMKTGKNITVYSLEDAANSAELFGYTDENGISDVSDFFTETEADKLQIDGNIILFVRVETPQSDIIIYWDGNYETGEDRIKKIL